MSKVLIRCSAGAVGDIDEMERWLEHQRQRLRNSVPGVEGRLMRMRPLNHRQRTLPGWMLELEVPEPGDRRVSGSGKRPEWLAEVIRDMRMLGLRPETYAIQRDSRPAEARRGSGTPG